MGKIRLSAEKPARRCNIWFHFNLESYLSMPWLIVVEGKALRFPDAVPFHAVE